MCADCEQKEICSTRKHIISENQTILKKYKMFPKWQSRKNTLIFLFLKFYSILFNDSSYCS